MAIVTVSYQMGAGGSEIGMGVAQRLGYRYVDQELIQDAVQRYGLAEDKASHLDESKPSLFERFDAETRYYITILQSTLLDFAETDNAVLMGRGGQWLLRGIPHVLRMRVLAPFEQRVRRWIKRTADVTGETPSQRAAADFVRRDDTEKSGRMRYLYEVDVDDPMLYDVILNTEKVRFDAAVDAIVSALRRPEMTTTEAGLKLVVARALASRVQVALATNPETRRYRISVDAEDGVITLEGTSELEQAVEVARMVPGVRDVRTRQVEIPPIPPFVA
ncbi:MAG: cytidylate kinase family protein [Candidatus Rokubacteria bacterium]|nr:cytidylate kinase family protein [Candidatus Rokubacteria bacterium]MBI3827508.1 cytidylate kinase family protein [Candidatus Rokubacteria bacterium]